MREVFFGLGLKYDDGSHPSVSINRHGRIVEVHKNELGRTLWSHVGAADGRSVRWHGSHDYTGGVDPCVALNAGNTVVEVHKNEAGTTLYHLVGIAHADRVEWGPSHDYDHGVMPSVALNDAGFVVEVHQTQSPFSDRLWYSAGPVQGDAVEFGDSDDFANGDYPRVAMNNDNLVVLVYEKDDEVRYRTGTAHPSRKFIDFHDEHFAGDGVRPAVAVTDDGTVILVYRSGLELVQRTGHVNGSIIDWFTGPRHYDDGAYPSVAVASNLAIEVHEGELTPRLWYETSILTDRASWMKDRLGTLGNRPLGSLVLPASHDAGMYLGSSFSVFGKTQDLSIYEQLAYGIRWFDLRTELNHGQFYIHHGGLLGPKMETVLDDVSRFCQEHHQELVILKLSHFNNIDDAAYKKLVDLVNHKTSPWLVTSTVPGKRLAEMTLSEYVPYDRAAILVVVDGDYAINVHQDGFWVYRDWDSKNPKAGHLRVFDVYSDKISFSTMKSDQLQKFNDYDGWCKNDNSVPCEMFLLSWTLTPPTYVWLAAQEADRELGVSMTELAVPNRFGKIVNMLYVDYSEFARVTDVALVQNGERVPLTTSAEHTHDGYSRHG